jgi:osmotically-inducible protein OsmY
MNKYLLLALLTGLTQLQGCAGVVAAGAATGAVVIHDRRSLGTVIDDQGIELKGAHSIAERKDISTASRIRVFSNNGMVLLVGQTPYSQYSNEAKAIVNKIQGVRRVYNELRIRKPVSLSVQSNDTWITSKIKTRMLAEKHFDSTRFSVVTEDGEVFLMGLVTRAEGDKAVGIARNISGVRKVIRVFEYVQSGTGSPAGQAAVSQPPLESESDSGGVQMGAPADEVLKF